ncbi:hypothetical protein J5J83_22830, partial [Azoarcus sp. L1K30]|uniref:DUF6531 domain-containing protein n=1 Tax=Azoarcus sp. L1K30 TaxID=2820277 RepID=UPI001B8259C7
MRCSPPWSGSTHEKAYTISGKPAIRIGDAVVKGKIVTGSATVLIGDAGEGAADRCPVGEPVNPIVGAKLLPAETDFALPAPAPFVFARSYISRDARIGPLGQGWSTPGDGLGLGAGREATVVIDAQRIKRVRVVRSRYDGQGWLTACSLPDGSAWHYAIDDDT